MRIQLISVSSVLLFSLFQTTHGFQPNLPRSPLSFLGHSIKFSNIFNCRKLQAATTTLDSSSGATNNDFSLSKFSEPVVPGPHFLMKGKVLTIWGLLYAISTLATALVTLPFMFLFTGLCEIFGDGKRRRILDWMIHFWANTAMSLVFFRPRVIGLENLPPVNETVIYVPNHTSVMDILALSGFVPRPFKYLSKAEILKIPIIGRAMILAKHVFIRREDVLDAFGTAEKCVKLLKDGNSMVLFAEGTRSPDGRIRKFKKGAFQMAKTAGVKVVPVTISNLHRWMPVSALLPLAPARGVTIQIHPALDTAAMTVKELKNKCFEAVNSGLLPYQRKIDDERLSSSAEE